MSGPSTTLDRPESRWPSGLLGMLALIVIVELVIGGRRLDFTTVWADDWRRTAEATTRQARQRDVLIFGDSLVKFSILPKQVEATVGLRSYNLALNAGTVPSAYFLLRQTLEGGVKPRAIVADFCTLMQPDWPMRSIRMYPDLATVRDVFDFAWTSGDSEFLTTTLLGKLLPSFKCRYEIRESIKAAFDGRRASPWPVHSVVWKRWKEEDGAQPMPTNGQDGPFNPGMASDISPKGWQCDKLNATYVERFLKLAESHKIPVFWVIPPLQPDVHVLRAAQGSDEAYDQFVRATLDRHPGVVVLDARRSGYDRSLYIDTIHLSEQGGRVLSTDLARVLASRLGNPDNADRWVSLPRFNRQSGEIATGAAAGARR